MLFSLTDTLNWIIYFVIYICLLLLIRVFLFVSCSLGAFNYCNIILQTKPKGQFEFQNNIAFQRKGKKQRLYWSKGISRTDCRADLNSRLINYIWRRERTITISSYLLFFKVCLSISLKLSHESSNSRR